MNDLFDEQSENIYTDFSSNEFAASEISSFIEQGLLEDVKCEINAIQPQTNTDLRPKVTDSISGRQFLVDTGAFSVIPTFMCKKAGPRN